MKWRQKLNRVFNTCLIEKNQIVVGEMMRYNMRYGRISDRRTRARFVLGLYLKYGIAHKDPLRDFEKRICRLWFPESEDSEQISLEELYEKLRRTETIVFDVWGVLLCRGLEEHQFWAIAECEELTFGISERLESGDGTYQVRKRKGADSRCEYKPRLEQLTIDFTLDNPFIHRLWDALLAEGKKLLFYNNSDCDDILTDRILQLHGYRGNMIRETADLVHITNHTKHTKHGSDIVYRDVNQTGSRYRTYYEYNVVTNLTDRIVNLLLHGDGNKKEVFYEYGVTCGGILTCGFCHWLNELAERKKVDLFLFVARDGKILQRIYQEHYGNRASDYLIFSRFASFELIYEEHPEEYLDKNIRPRLERKGCDNSVRGILLECGLDFLLRYLPEDGLTESDILYQDNYEQFKSWMMYHHQEITSCFLGSCQAAEQYYREVCKDHRNICVVDLGWHGKSVTYLKYFMEVKCGMKVCVTGAMIGACDDVVTQDHIRKGLIDIYAFENERWRSQGSRNGERMGYREIICTEALFSSTEDSLLKYGLGENGETVFVYGKRNENVSAVMEIHRGIVDFAEHFARVQKQYGLRVTSRDAYTPLYYRMKNKRFVDWLYEHYRETEGALNGFGGACGKRDSRPSEKQNLRF